MKVMPVDPKKHPELIPALFAIGRELLASLHRKVVPGPWRWGDWAPDYGREEERRRTLESGTDYGPFPQVRRRDDSTIRVLPPLEDWLELDDKEWPNAQWITALSPMVFPWIDSWLKGSQGMYRLYCDRKWSYEEVQTHVNQHDKDALKFVLHLIESLRE